MGKYTRKCKGLGDVAVMEVAQVGVRTRARALAEESGTVKRRKVGTGKLRLSTTSFVQIVVTPENSVSPAVSSDQCTSVSSGHVTASCCSSNGSTEIGKEKPNFADLEELECVEFERSRYNLDRRERRESTPTSKLQTESGELESTAKPSELSSRLTITAEKIPPQAELDEFFATAEKDLHKRFKEKYNYDIVKDVPLEGRFNWVRLKP